MNPRGVCVCKSFSIYNTMQTTTIKQKRRMKCILILAVLAFPSLVDAQDRNILLEQARSLNQNAAHFLDQGDYGDALPLYERSLVLTEKALGPQHPGTATALNELAVVYQRMGNYAKALPLFEQSLVIYEKVLGPQHPDTATALNNLAGDYESMGDYAKALPLFDQALSITEKTSGAQHPDTAASLNNLAMVYNFMGNYAKALPLLERALSIWEKALGSDNRDTLTAMTNLASVYVSMGNCAKALSLCERSLMIREKTCGPQHPETAGALKSLADVYISMGDYPKAVPLLERSLTIWESSVGPQHRNAIATRSDLATAYTSMGDYARALTLYEYSLALAEKTLGSQHLVTAAALNNLASVYVSMGDYAKAVPLLERSVDIWEKTLGPQHPDTATALNNLALAYSYMKNYEKALPLYERSLAIREMTLGPQNRATAVSLNNLALVYSSIGKYEKALPLYERSLAINEKTLGSRHPDTTLTLVNLATIYYLMGDLANARAFANRAASSGQDVLQKILTLDEQSRLSWQSMAMRFTVEPCVMQAEEIAQLILRWKGIVLDSLIKDRVLTASVSGNSASREKLSEIQRLRSRMSILAFSEKTVDREQSEQLLKQIASLERSMASNTSVLDRTREDSNISISAILPALINDAVLIDFIQFTDPKLKSDEAASYGAAILTKDGRSVFVRFDAVVIDHSIQAMRAALVNGDEAVLTTNLKTLTENLWQPIASKLPNDTKTLIISPDGLLNFLSFAALEDADGRFISEKYEIVYVGSGRNLASNFTKTHNNQLLIFANPVFDQISLPSATNRLDTGSVELSAFAEIRLPQLPGTEIEGKAVGELGKAQGWTTSEFFGNEATKRQVCSLKEPGILHLATHGFYLNSITENEDSARGMKVIGLNVDPEKYQPKNSKVLNPMRASGIALTGAQTTLTAWGEGNIPDPDNDGILTAEDVAGLDLEGTWLVTLSACETGIGAVKSGEGVFGLRRAFMMAGAQNLLMTLWPVNDVITADIMRDFYQRALVSDDAPKALADTQRDWLVKLRKEKGLLPAVRDAGPFIMTTAGALPHSGIVSGTQKAQTTRSEIQAPDAEALIKNPRNTEGSIGTQEQQVSIAQVQAADTELNRVYKEVLSKLTPQDKEKIRQSQREWIKQRDAAVRANPGRENEVLQSVTLQQIETLKSLDRSIRN